MQYSLYSWNVNGIRAVLKKGVLQELLQSKNPDFLCLQETKAKKDQVEVDFPDYQEVWNSADRAGYSGTAIFAKNHQPMQSTELNLEHFLATQTDPEITKILGQLHQDQYGAPLNEGRITTVETPHFYLVTVYTPNSKNDLSRLNLRHDLWDPLFLYYIKYLEQTKPVVFCGDLNVSHQEIDLARPKQNTKNAGFTQEEREGIENYIKNHFLDTFRTLHPETIKYSWWSHWGHARENNVGWRIDYFFISKILKTHLLSAEIHDQILGSDHCPISITLQF
jgi:exodeoxyribonuclease III